MSKNYKVTPRKFRGIGGHKSKARIVVFSGKTKAFSDKRKALRFARHQRKLGYKAQVKR
jgi:hypothetical protein